jgi:hypothetical protein
MLVDSAQRVALGEYRSAKKKRPDGAPGKRSMHQKMAHARFKKEILCGQNVGLTQRMRTA